MKTFEDLKKYYLDVLLPELQIIEEKRKEVLKRLILFGSILTGLYGLLLILFFYLHINIETFFLSLVIFIGISLVGYRFLTKSYVGEFKTSIIKKIVHFIDENLEYLKNKHISKADFVKSKIFHRHPDRLKGDDYVTGTVEKTKLEFSEIHAEYRTTDSKGNRRWHTIFKGLFFIADFNKNFKGLTVVLPDTAERLFGHLGSMFQSWNITRNQLIKLEDPEFEKLFVVYGDNQIEARYILSTSLMKRIVDFKRKTKQKIYISFVGSKIFVAVFFRRALFEPNVFKTVLDFGQILEYYEDLQLALGIVEDLNLNTRIWSKR